MATRSIKRMRDDSLFTDWKPQPERAPSIVREETPTIARILSMVGVLLAAVGLLAMLAPLWNKNYVVGPDWGGVSFSLGVLLIVFHAFADKDVQYRRIYGFLGLALAFVSILFRVLPLGGSIGAFFMPYGIPGLFLSLLFFLAVLRNETEPAWRSFFLNALLFPGIVMVVAGAGIGFFRVAFLTGEGNLLMTLGLLYLGGYIGLRGANDGPGYLVALALGVFGLAVFFFAMLISFLATDFIVPSGWILMAFGLLFFAVSLGAVSDWTFVVLVRRELASFFFSAVGYLVLIGVTLIGWFNFLVYVFSIFEVGRMGEIPEPILGFYIISIIPVFFLMFVVPVITMRLLSEEKRSGTLEVLLTAPVGETTVTLSKFTAALIFYLVTWAPWLLFLVGLRTIGGEEFDYRPVLSFALALLVSGGAFIAIGLFFSSVTRNQIIAAVLTFVVLMLMLGAYIMRFQLQISRGGFWWDILEYMSFLDLWQRSLRGQFAPRYLMFHLSATIFFLFATAKVLESRKWS